MAKRLVETVLTISILGEEPYEGGLNNLWHAITFGDYSGYTRSEVTREITDEGEIQKLCEEHGSDPSFFFGDDLEDVDG